MGIRISAPSAYIAGVILGIPLFLAAAKTFLWVMSMIGTAS